MTPCLLQAPDTELVSVFTQEILDRGCMNESPLLRSASKTFVPEIGAGHSYAAVKYAAVASTITRAAWHFMIGSR